MTVDSAHKSRWEIAEVVFGIPFLISVALQWVVPFSIHQGILRQAMIPIGIALIITGVVFIVLGRREFARYAQPTDPGHPTSSLVKTGVYSRSRNPLYLGTALTIFGIALALNNLWTLLTLLLSILLCYPILILPEEHYLSKKFGREYAEYMAAVHRWFGGR